MGKCGARELNYVSDVDVIFVGEPLGEGETTQGRFAYGPVGAGDAASLFEAGFLTRGAHRLALDAAALKRLRDQLSRHVALGGAVLYTSHQAVTLQGEGRSYRLGA